MTRRTRLDWYDRYSDGDREITFLPRQPLGPCAIRLSVPNRSLWGGYLIRTAGGADHLYFPVTVPTSMGSINWPTITISTWPSSTWAPMRRGGSWRPSHMNPAETVRAFQEIKARRLMIAHWGTFQLGDEPVHLPPARFEKNP